MTDNPAAAAVENAAWLQRIQQDLDDAGARVLASNGSHHAVAASHAAQCDALHYLLHMIGVPAGRIQASKATPPDPDLRDGLLHRLQDGFYRHYESSPAATTTGAHGEQINVSTLADVQRKAARLDPESDYRCGVTDALEWILSRLSHIEINSVDNGVIRIQGWLGD